MDQLLTSMGWPYTKEFMAIPLPWKLRIPTMELYDEGLDPLEHLDNFKAHMTLHGYPDEVACRAF